MLSIIKLRALSLLAFFVCVGLSPAMAKPKQSIKLEWVSVEEFVSHYQTNAGTAITFPELALKGSLEIGSPKWHFEFRRFTGSSQTDDTGFHVSLGDFEGRVAYRLDDPSQVGSENSPSKNIHTWVGWKIWTSTNFFSTGSFKQRDEGLGFGISRHPTKTSLSYWYEASVYPSVHTRLAEQKDAYTLSAGGVYNFTPSLALTLGYRLQTLKTGRQKTDRAQEQGIIFGLRGTF